MLNRRFIFFSFLLASLYVAICAPNIMRAQEGDSTIKLPPKDKFRIVVLAGQSNMAGRGFLEEADKIPNPRIFKLTREGKWAPATEPIHYDKSSAGVGPGRAFAERLVDSDPTICVGLVPTACGGSSIDDWEPGVYFKQTSSHPYDDAIARTRRALEDGTLEAILWRQGEADATLEKAATHEEKLLTLFKRLRQELDAPDVPILVGELFFSEPNAGAEAIRDAQIAAVKRAQPAAFVSSEGVRLNPDKVHFDRKSQIEQGDRFFEAFRLLKERKTANE